MRLEVEKNPSQVLVPARPVGQSEFAGTSSNVAELLNVGIRAAQSGDRADARAALFRVTEADPKNEAAWLWLASISEYPEELLVFLNNILAINPENERASEWKASTNSLLSKTFVQRGIDAAGTGKEDFATECFSRALEFDQNNEMAWLWKASLADTTEGRIGYLETVLKINPQNEAAARAFLNARKEKTAEHLANAKTAAVEGRKDEAYDLLKSVIDDDPACEDAWLLRSHFADSLDEKILSYQRVLEINPTNQAARVSLDSLGELVGLARNEPSSDESRPSFASEFQHDSTLQYGPEIDRIPTQDLEIPAEIVDELRDFEARSFSPSIVEEITDLKGFEPAAIVEQPPFTGESGRDDDTDLDGIVPPTAEFQAPESDSIEEPSFEAASSFDQSEPVKYVPTFAVSPFSVEEVQSSGHIYLSPLETNSSIKVSTDDDSVDETIEVSSADSFASPDAETTEFRVEEVVEEDSFEAATYADSSSSVAEKVDDEPAAEIEEIEAEITDSVVDELVTGGEVETESDVLSTPEVTKEFTYSSERITIPASAEGETVDDDPYKTVSLKWTDIPGSSPWESVVAEQTVALDSEQEFVRNEITSAHSPTTLCAFCGSANEFNTISCRLCFAVLTLSDLDMIIGNMQADKQTIRASVEEMEKLRSVRELSETELTMLGIGHLNLQELESGYDVLHDAAKMNPNNVVLSSQVNSLLIKIGDVRKHDETLGSMTKGKTILVVDDSPTVRKLISGKLEKCGHDVFCSSDGVEALQVLDAMKPDLILLDINMPNMDGYQTCKAIRNIKELAGVPIVMISGKDGFFDKVRGKMAGTSGYITKPFGPETLMKTVETFLAGQTIEMPEEAEAEV
mgnify:CR=1 FL=1